MLILGCGFTGWRVAVRLRKRGFPVLATSREPKADLRVEVTDWDSLDRLEKVITPDTLVLHSIPVPGVMKVFERRRPARIVYLSTTGVYGQARDVDERTAVAPRTPREALRVDEERRVLAGPWEALVLRPAAIYGPHRGIHSSMRSGKYRLAGEGRNFVSRIHVDDLAGHVEAGLLSNLTGAFPVADELPCTSREIARFCAQLLNLPVPPSVADDQLGETRRVNRRVDGSAIRRALGIRLRYPSYREGIPACLEEEARALPIS